MKMQNKLAVVLAAAALLALTATSAFAAGWVQEGAEWRYVDNSGDYVTDTMKKSGTTTFYLDENGYMAKDYFAEYNDNYYYFGSNGAMVTNTWVAIDPSLVEGAPEGYDVCWFYFQGTGKAVKQTGEDVKKQTIDGKTYCFNDAGIMLTGWISQGGDWYDPEEDEWWGGATYYAGADGVLRNGWLAWTDGVPDHDDENIGTNQLGDKEVLYFYFGNNNKIIKNKDKTINGKKYHFNENGLMLSGWEYMEIKYADGGTYDGDGQLVKLATASNNKYFSGEDDGHMVKKGWIYAVPSEIIDAEGHEDDEEEYFYAENSGSIVVGKQKRINGKYYVFNSRGIMQTGLVILDSNKNYLDVVDLEYTDGKELIKEGKYESDDDFSTATEELNLTGAAGEYTIHYFGDDGSKITGNKINIEFADEVFVFASKNKGGFVDETKDKYYSNGFLCKASEDIRLGMVATDKAYWRQPMQLSDLYIINTTNYNDGTTLKSTSTDAKIKVVNTSGSVKNKNNKYKDADGYYWMTNAGGYLVGIFDCEVKWTSDGPKWKSDFPKEGDSTESKEEFRSFATEDFNGLHVYDKLVTSLNDDYCTNFTFLTN